MIKNELKNINWILTKCKISSLFIDLSLQAALSLLFVELI